MELHLFVETFDPGQAEWADRFQAAWAKLLLCAKPIPSDPANPPPDRKAIDRHLNAIEALLRELD